MIEKFLFDEPTSALDKKTARNIINIIKQISKEKTVIVVSHNNIIDKYADKILFIEKGKLIEKG